MRVTSTLVNRLCGKDTGLQGTGLDHRPEEDKAVLSAAETRAFPLTSAPLRFHQCGAWVSAVPGPQVA